MSGNLQRETVGTTLTQAEYEASDGGAIQFASQATGDVPYASSATVIEGLAIGSANQVLIVSGGIPAWSSNVNVQGTLDAQGAATLASTLDVTGLATFSAGATIPDSQTLIFGTGSDATVAYDGTDLVITPAAVGAGDVVISGGGIELDDSEPLRLGTGNDAAIQYDGSNLLINPRAVGSGILNVTGGRIQLGTSLVTPESTANALVLVAPASTDTGIALQGSATGSIHFGDAADADVGRILYTHSSDTLSLYANATQAVDIDSSANVLVRSGKVTVGTTTLQEGGVHVHTASAGSVTASTAADELVVENNAAGGITILTPNTTSGAMYFGDPEDNDVGGLQYNHSANNMRLYAAGGIKGHVDATGIQMVTTGTTVNRGTTNPTNALSLFNGTAPSGTLTNGVTLYSASGELRVMDSGGASTLLSPHDDDGYWVYDSSTPQTGKHLHIHMEKMLKALNDHFGWNFIEETDL